MVIETMIMDEIAEEGMEGAKEEGLDLSSGNSSIYCCAEGERGRV